LEASRLERPVDVRLAPAPAADARLASRVAATLGLAATSAAAIAVFGPMLGMRVPPAALVFVALGAVAAEAAPARAFAITAGAGLLALAAVNKVYAAYHLALVALLVGARRSTLATAVALAGLAIWLPKHLFSAHYFEPGLYNWINEPSLALALFVTALAWRVRRDGRLPASAEQASPAAWSLFYLFPGHAINPMVYSPADLLRERRFDARGVVTALALVAAKALAHASLRRWLPTLGYATLDAARAASASRVDLWAVALVGYVDLAITLSGTADLAILVARLYGWQLPSPFRFALLAWNPSELWRRWGLYNRKWLLQMVYFPLGGARRRRALNVMATFIASGLVLHTGWFGSKYWEVGPGGWRDETAYFALQGLLVCGWLAWRDRRRPAGADAGVADDRALRLTWRRAAGTAATQAASALVHVVVLAQALPFADRWVVMARMLGVR
jgi:hypothetical protein